MCDENTEELTLLANFRNTIQLLTKVTIAMQSFSYARWLLEVTFLKKKWINKGKALFKNLRISFFCVSSFNISCCTSQLPYLVRVVRFLSVSWVTVGGVGEASKAAFQFTLFLCLNSFSYLSLGCPEEELFHSGYVCFRADS